MKNTIMQWAVVAAVVGASSVSAFGAQEPTPQKTLPTLLIKGDVVSVDTTDAAATLLKVKDRYGFETPIYLTQETKVGQGSQTLAVANLTPGTAVEVEYNFDINTAKRHAVRVEVGAAAQSASTAAPAAATNAATPAAPGAAPSTTTPFTVGTSTLGGKATLGATPSTTTPPAPATPPAMPAAKAMPATPAAASAATTPPAPASAAPSTGGATAKEHPGKEHAGTSTQ